MKRLFPLYSIGHFINEPANRSELEITRFEKMIEPDVHDPHRHTFYEIIWVEKGNSKQVIDYAEYRISPQSLFFISPGQVHAFEEWKHLRGGSVLFTEDFFLINQQHKDKLFELSFLDNFYSNPLLRLNPSSFLEVCHTITSLESERYRKEYSPEIAQSLLHVLLLQIQRCIDSTSQQVVSRGNMVLFKRFKILIDRNFNTNQTTSDYANKLHVSQHHLNHIARLVTGKTATEVIRSRSILEAKRLLSFTDYNVNEVASQLGYFDSSYFTKLFRKETGVSPLNFRKTMSVKYRTR